MSFDARIRLYRKEKGLSQQDMAVLLDISTGTVGNWEKGRFLPIDDVLPAIARKMGVSEQWLRTGEGEMFSAYDIGMSQDSGTIKATTPTHHGQTTSTTGGDMTYDPSWVVPMLLSAHVAKMHSNDLERARRMKEAGLRFIVRLVVEEPDNDKEPPPPRG